MRGGTAACDSSVMFKKSKTRRLREMQVEARAAALLGRIFLLELARWSYEGVRRRRTLEIGALAVGLTTVGIAAKHALHGPDAPTPVA